MKIEAALQIIPLFKKEHPLLRSLQPATKSIIDHRSIRLLNKSAKRVVTNLPMKIRAILKGSTEHRW